MAAGRRALTVSLGLAVSAGALWLTLRGKDLGAIWDAMRAADYRYLAWYLLVLLAIHVVRTARWGLLLAPVADVPLGRLNAASAVGFMALVLFPFRIGEIARPYLVSEPGRLRVSTALSSIVAERVADGVLMGAILVAVLLQVPDSAPGVGLLRTAGVAATLLFLGLLAFLAIAYRSRALAVRLAAGALRVVSPRAAERVGAMVDAFLHGLRLVKGLRRAAAFAALTGLFWGLNAFGMRLLGLGFDLELGALEATAVLGALVVGVMIPAGPGMVGTFQGAVVLGLSLFLAPETVATRGTAYANVLWGAQIGLQTALGLAFMFSRHIRFDQLLVAPED